MLLLSTKQRVLGSEQHFSVSNLLYFHILSFAGCRCQFDCLQRFRISPNQLESEDFSYPRKNQTDLKHQFCGKSGGKRKGGFGIVLGPSPAISIAPY